MSPHSGHAGAQGNSTFVGLLVGILFQISSEEQDLPKYSTSVGQRRQMGTVGCVKNWAIEYEMWNRGRVHGCSTGTSC